MLKGVTTNGVVILGLDGENWSRLTAGKPIVFDLADLGLPTQSVVILGGQTLHDVGHQIEQLSKLLPFTCPKCRSTSHNPHDRENGYCGNCHEFTGDTTTQRTG